MRELGEIRGRHTELVSVYVSAGGNLIDTINQLENEKSTASNIKSKTTRKNVMSALEKIIQHLRTFRQTPPNGLVVFGGNISPVEGKEDYRIWSFEPPEKMETKVYWCDQVFVLDPLKDLISEKSVYGLIVLDAREANVGLLSGKKINNLKHIESNVPSKTVKGGMSQGRYDRIREDAVHEFLTEAGEVASKILLEQKNLSGVIIGGPGPVKDRFYREKYLNYQIQNKVLGVKDIGYTGDYGLEELINRSQDLLKEATVAKEREIMKKFFTGLQKNEGIAYGYTETLRALEMGAVGTLLVSEDFNWVHATLRCANSHVIEVDLPKEKIDQQVCDVCETKMSSQHTKELTDVITEKAAEKNAKIEIISTDTMEGKQFRKLGGVGAFLRYKID